MYPQKGFSIVKRQFGLSIGICLVKKSLFKKDLKMAVFLKSAELVFSESSSFVWRTQTRELWFYLRSEFLEPTQGDKFRALGFKLLFILDSTICAFFLTRKILWIEFYLCPRSKPKKNLTRSYNFQGLHILKNRTNLL